MAKCLRDCVLVPIPKSGKDASCSANYHPIALASTLSKALEHIILEKYSKFFVSMVLLQQLVLLFITGGMVGSEKLMTTDMRWMVLSFLDVLNN